MHYWEVTREQTVYTVLRQSWPRADEIESPSLPRVNALDVRSNVTRRRE